MHFPRPALASDLARLLLSPTPLEGQLGSAVCLAGSARTGKSTFLRSDLVPELARCGVLGVYADVGVGNRQDHFGQIRTALLASVQRKPAESGRTGAHALLDAAARLLDVASTDVVLIVDGIHGAASKKGRHSLLQSLSEVVREVNAGATRKERLRLLACGGGAASMQALLSDGGNGLAGARIYELPALDAAFVDFVLKTFGRAAGSVLPAPAVAADAFERLGHRPEELLRAFALLRELPKNHDPDTALAATANALRIAISERQHSRLAELGALPFAVFSRMADGELAPFSDGAKSAYEQDLGRRPSTSEIQTALTALVSAKHVVRTGRGAYSCADPMASKLWREHRQLNTDSMERQP